MTKIFQCQVSRLLRWSSNLAGNGSKLYPNHPKTRTGQGSFVDLKRVRLSAGHGGNGAISFIKTNTQEYGPPSGGTGGRGGTVWIKATKDVILFLSFLVIERMGS